MLADFLAATATPTPMPADAHSPYDWWSDIVLPTAVGAGSLLVAVLAVLIARRSNRLSAASTRAAERSNALARRAIALDEQRALEDRQRGLAEEREEFAGRVVVVLDEFVRAMETDDSDRGVRAYDALEVLQTELMIREFLDVPLLDGIAWGTELNTRLNRVKRLDRPVNRRDLFELVRRSYEPALAAWARDPRSCHRMIETVDALFHRRLDEELGPWK